MAGRFTVVLDACVLYPAPLRDLLMQLAMADLFRARWTDQIHAEWMNNLLLRRPDLSPLSPHHPVSAPAGLPLPLPGRRPEFPLPSVPVNLKDYQQQVEQNPRQGRFLKGWLNRLDQSILDKAFSGKLVPKDPNDEPASVLLEFIQAAAPKAKRGRKAKG